MTAQPPHRAHRQVGWRAAPHTYGGCGGARGGGGEDPLLAEERNLGWASSARTGQNQPQLLSFPGRLPLLSSRIPKTVSEHLD